MDKNERLTALIDTCPAPTAKKRGGPKRTKLKEFRTKAWANYCATTGGADSKRLKATEITRMIIEQRSNSSTTANELLSSWKKYLAGTQGVIDPSEADRIWPGASEVFEIGPIAPPAQAMQDIAKSFPWESSSVPLWAAIKGDKLRTRADKAAGALPLLDMWKNIDFRAWILWSPWKIPYDHNDMFDYKINNRGELRRTDKFWTPREEDFSSKKALIHFLYDYTYNPSTYPCTSALLNLTACITMCRLENWDFLPLPPAFTFLDTISSELTPYGITLQDIRIAACEFGLTILTYEEYQYLLVDNPRKARGICCDLTIQHLEQCEETFKRRDMTHIQNLQFKHPIQRRPEGFKY